LFFAGFSASEASRRSSIAWRSLSVIFLSREPSIIRHYLFVTMQGRLVQQHCQVLLLAYESSDSYERTFTPAHEMSANAFCGEVPGAK